MTVAGPQPPLWRDRHFSTFWISQTLSELGDMFAYIAIPLLVLHATGSVARMGLLTGAAGVAAVGTGLFAGLLVDRMDRRRLMIACDLARMVLYALVPLVWQVAGPQVWLLYVVLPAGAAVGMVFQVGYVTAVRNLVDLDRITAANGGLNASFATAGVGGPLLAGLVSGWLGPTAAVAVDAASFALSAAGLALIRFRRSGRPEADGPRGGPLAELFAGARFLWRTPVLRALTVLLAFFVFFTFGLADLLIYHIKHDMGRPDGTVGVVLGLGALGTVAGALVAAWLRRVAGFGPTWIASVAMGGIAVAGAGMSLQVGAVAAFVAVVMCTDALGGTCSMSLRQEITPDALLGRVTSAFWTIHFSLGPAGAAVLTWAAGRYGVDTVCLVTGAGMVLLAAASLATPARRSHPERDAPSRPPD